MPTPDLTHRRLQHEWMDADDVEPGALGRSLRFIRRVNRLLGYTRATIGHLGRLTAALPAGTSLSVLDVATGSADVPVDVLRWADRRGLRVSVVGLDRHALTLDAARAAAGHPQLRLVRGDALALPFADRSFDIAMTSMFLHHLDERAIVAVLRELDRVTRRGVIVADLLRHRRAHRWIRLFTLLSDPMVKHDAVVSVEQAFAPAEVIALRDRAGLGYLQLWRHFGHRFVLAGLKH